MGGIVQMASEVKEFLNVVQDAKDIGNNPVVKRALQTVGDKEREKLIKVQADDGDPQAVITIPPKPVPPPPSDIKMSDPQHEAQPKQLKRTLTESEKLSSRHMPRKKYTSRFSARGGRRYARRSLTWGRRFSRHYRRSRPTYRRR